MAASLHFEEDSRLIQSGSKEVSPEEAARAGKAFAYAMCGSTKNPRLLIAHSGRNGSGALAAAFAAGAAAEGADCITAGACAYGAAAHGVRSLGCTGGCYAHTEISASFALMAGDGLALLPDSEERTAAGLSREISLPYAHYGRIIPFDGIRELYAARIKKLLPERTEGIRIDVSSSSEEVTDCCREIFSEINDPDGERIAFSISSDGRRISAYTEETGYIYMEKLQLMCYRDIMEKGQDAAVCGKPLKAAEKLAASMGRRMIGCSGVCGKGEPSEECIQARSAAAEQLISCDGIALAAAAAGIVSRKRSTLAKELSALPPVASLRRFIPADKPSELLKRLTSSDPSGRGGMVSDGEGGRVFITPVKTGSGLILSVESYAMEAAAELCDFYSAVIDAGRSSLKQEK